MRYLPGLTVAIGSEATQAMTSVSSVLPHQRHLIADDFAAAGLIGSLRRFPDNRAAGVFIDHERTSGIAIDAGPDLIIDGVRATPKILLDAYLKRGASFVLGLDGQFVLIAWNQKGDCLLATDRYGLRPHYRLRIGKGIVIGTSAQELSKKVNYPLKLDERAVYAALSYSRVVPGAITFFKDFEALAPATMMIWSDGNLQTETRYWDYFTASTPFNTKDSVDEIASAMRSAVQNSMQTGLRTGICLSGGLDSRIVLAAMSKEAKENVIAYTWGAKRLSDEVAIAGEIAEHAGVSWRFVQVNPADFVTDLEGAIEVLEGRDHAIQGYGRKAFGVVAQDCGAATTGLALDILVSGSYSSFLRDNDLETMPFDEAKDKILDRYRYFNFPTGEMFSNGEYAKQNIEEVKSLLKRDFIEVCEDRASNLDRFAFRQRVWRHIFPRQQWQRLFVEDVVPTFANGVMNALCGVKSKERANFSLAKSLLNHLDPTLMAIPYQGTLLPVSTPVEFWKSASQLEAQREALYRKIYFATQGRVYLPYDRYYTNFDEWQRMDPSWSEALDKYLLSDDSRLVSQYVRRDWVEKLIADQRTGAAANFARINVLISLEVLLRQFT
jgi:hypothetical protein